MMPQSLINAPPPISLTDNLAATQLGGKAGEQICTGLHGKYFTQCMRGNVFIGGGHTAGGYTLTSQNTGTPDFLIWNQAGSGINVVLLKVQMGIVTLSTVTQHLCISYATKVGLQAVSGGAIGGLTGSQSTPINAFLSSTKQAAGQMFVGNINVSGLTYLKSVGMSYVLAASPAAANNFWQLIEYYDGELIVGPGTLIAFSNNSGGNAFTSLNAEFIWEEVPV